MCQTCLSRRTLLSTTIGLFASRIAASHAAQEDPSAGCTFFQAAGSPELTAKGSVQFPGLRRPVGNSLNSLAAVSLELSLVFGVTVVWALYDDSASSKQGNAGVLDRTPWPVLNGVSPPDGVVAIGDRCFESCRASENQFAALAAVCAHEVGHLVQYKYVNAELYALRNRDRSVVRTELHADFVCGYYAAIRKQVQPDWPAVLQALNQFKFGDERVANPLHHGTPKQRGDAVQAGFFLGEAGRRTPLEVAAAGVQYVKALNLSKT